MNDRKRRLNDLLVPTTTTQSQNQPWSTEQFDNNYSVKRRVENHEHRTIDDASLYSCLRRWSRDDPPLLEKERMERESEQKKEKSLKTTVRMDNLEDIHLLIAGESTLSNDSVFFQNTKFSKADAQRRLHEHIHRFKKIRNRNKLVVASRYSRLREQLAAKQIPPLASLEIILEDCQLLSNGPIP